jgi:hypothetical protein
MHIYCRVDIFHLQITLIHITFDILAGRHSLIITDGVSLKNKKAEWNDGVK